jgi:hypothetical protein
MLSNLLELAGLASLVAGVDYLANPGWALIAAAPCLLFLGLAAEGLHPVRMGRTAAVDLRARAAAVFARRRAERQQRATAT